ncbi:uncharacterized protein LOC143671199 [Tamandua tetradactyla]|uniref:uncharacterized protein LOC143671199 n=1 Tax=Tamandua tetradactyla TaxID=48850 RepID=UPI0040544BC8
MGTLSKMKLQWNALRWLACKTLLILLMTQHHLFSSRPTTRLKFQQSPKDEAPAIKPGSPAWQARTLQLCHHHQPSSLSFLKDSFARKEIIFCFVPVYQLLCPAQKR